MDQGMYVCVIGGANIDILSTPTATTTEHDSNPGIIHLEQGGVARNIAETLALLDIPVKFITAVGDDVFGKSILQHCTQRNIDVSHSLVTSHATSCYNAISDIHGDLHIAVSDMRIMELVTPAFIKSKQHLIEHASLCVLDTNVSEEVLRAVLSVCTHTKCVIDTVSGVKAQKIKKFMTDFYVIKTNVLELQECLGVALNSSMFLRDEQSLHTIAHVVAPLFDGNLHMLVVSLGEEGVAVLQKSHADGTIQLSNIVYNGDIKIKNTTGGGDAMCAGIVYGMYHDMDCMHAVMYGMAAGIVTVEEDATVAEQLTVSLLQDMVAKEKLWSLDDKRIYIAVG